MVKAERMSMSSVGSTKAADVCTALGIKWVDGNKRFEIAEPAAGFKDTQGFKMHEYSTEPEATPASLVYFSVRPASSSFGLQADIQSYKLLLCWQDCLASLEVPFGPGGFFEVVDLRKNKKPLTV